MKILHIINSLTRGGAETLLVNSLSPDGLQEHAENHLLYFIKGDYLSSIVDKNVKQVCLNYKGGRDIFRMLWALRNYIRENNFDIIHTHLNPADFYVNLVRSKTIPQVHTVHIAYSSDIETGSFFKFLERKIYFDKKYANLIFLSEYTRKDFLDTVKFRGNSFVLNNFVDDSFFRYQPKKYTGTPETGLKLLAVGNFRQQKNYRYLLEIFKHLKQYNIHVDIYGDGDDMESCRQIIEQQELMISLKGQALAINEVIVSYDLFIMTSTNEGFPLSVFEAMAAGVPLALSNIKPLTSIVKDNAIYFELDNAEAVAGKLIAILENRVDITNMAIKARAYAESTVRRDIYIKNLLKIYKNVLSVEKKYE